MGEGAWAKGARGGQQDERNGDGGSESESDGNGDSKAYGGGSRQMANHIGRRR